MHFTIPFFALLTLALAFPQDDENPNPDMMLRTSDFQAYTSDATDGYANWIACLVSDDAHTMMATCSMASNETLYSDRTWHPCKVYASDPTIKLSFQIPAGFNEMKLKKSWESNGMYMSGMAAQGTHWNANDGGNATTIGSGTYYVQAEPWAFEITNISG
ncbi:hypothetical protein DE146DRAFT_437056 [Phaeosphaeria sp. MPI-PUGE-AT-0046c]|nr:hypothetical protein DE146DRAFT_437056 [Phaeosphaeria sp. MPI-PUGE-AT-0046c]